MKVELEPDRAGFSFTRRLRVSRSYGILLVSTIMSDQQRRPNDNQPIKSPWFTPGECEHDMLRREISSIIKEATDAVRQTGMQLHALRDQYETPLIIKDVRQALVDGEIDNVSVDWLRARYEIGYARSARIVDQLVADGIIDEPVTEDDEDELEE